MTTEPVKHTPGPWHRRHGYIVEINGGVLANVPFTTGDDEDKANARLIAAAPDLLEALKEVYESLSCEYGYDATDSIKQVIDKAEKGE